MLPFCFYGPFTQEEVNMNSQESKDLTLKELAAARNLKVSWLYERSRRNELPGQRRYGRLIRVNLQEFDQGVEKGGLI